MQDPTKPFERAVVIGGSMTGLLAARVLADHFQRVTIIERDEHPHEPQFRRGVPQGRHAHALLLRGSRTIAKYYPHIRESLVERGAQIVNMGRDVRWHQFGVWKCRYDSGLDAIAASRPLIEWTIAEATRQLPNVHMLHGRSVTGLLMGPAGIRGVRLRPRGQVAGEVEYPADLVIDASGRGSQTPAQLRQLGFPTAPETTLRIDLGYASGIFEPSRGTHDWRVLYVVNQPPAGKRGGLILPLEGGRWMATLVGMHGDHPPAEHAAFLEFAKTLPAPDVHDALVDARPLTDIVRYATPASLRRHYERLRKFPEGLLVFGDAMCAFNPIYGQGMSAAAMYAEALDQCLSERAVAGRNLSGIWRSFFPRAARVADGPWEMALGEDMRYRETTGPRSPMLRLLHWYTAKVQRASGRVPLVTERLYEVMHLLKPATTLFAPEVMRHLIARAPSAHGRESKVAIRESSQARAS
jgi:2-polyprenyl-6-methoxyphenol hydroxylase-like FAD-dependent oxidoreductase